MSNINYSLSDEDIKNVPQALDDTFSSSMSIPPIMEFIDNTKKIPGFDKSLQESKQILTTFSEKMKKYPFNISERGCEIFCIAMVTKRCVSLKEMPNGDVETIKSKVPSNINPNKMDDLFTVEMESNGDFKLTFLVNGISFEMFVFNSVKNKKTSPPINILPINILPTPVYGQAVDIRTPNKSSNGRNAFDIRCDVLQMAVDIGKINNTVQCEHVLDLAKKLYTFVENKK